MKNPFLDRSSLVRVAVSDLKLGMFIAELDRPWLETPFLVQGFVVKTPSEVRKLKEYCRYVYVDNGGRPWAGKRDNFNPGFKIQKRGLLDEHQPNKRTAAYQKPPQEQSKLLATVHSRREYQSTEPMDKERVRAKETYQHAKGCMKGLLDEVRIANMVDTKAAKETVGMCVKSMLRNPDALMWMTRIKDVNEYTAEHCLNVAILAIAFGRHLRLPESELEKLGMCGLLHDVGKLKIPDHIINKPDRLTEKEFRTMQAHTAIGRKLLMQSGGAYQYAIDAAYNHHEQMDGKGYPRGLRAAELSDYSRIISVVDAFDAMTSDRCYSTARSNLDALKEIYKGRGTQFDEELALEFIRVVGPYPPGTIVELQNGFLGIVQFSKDKKRHLPAVELVRDASGNKIEPKVVNLLHVEQGTLPKNYLIKKVLKNGERGVSLQDFPVRLMLNPDTQDSE